MAEQRNSKHEAAASEDPIRVEPRKDAVEPVEPHERILSTEKALPVAERNAAAPPLEPDDFEFVIEDDEPALGEPHAEATSDSSPTSAHGDEPSFDNWLRSRDSAESPSEPADPDSISLPKRPAFVSGADELAQMSEEPAHPADASTEAEHAAPKRPQLEDLSGITEPENVVGGEDLMQQLDALEDFDSSDPDPLADDFDSIDDDFVEEPFRLPDDEDSIQPIRTSIARPPRTRPVSIPLAAALLLVITAGAYFTWFHQPPVDLDEASYAGAPTASDDAADDDPATDAGETEPVETIAIFDHDDNERRVTTTSGSSMAEADLIADLAAEDEEKNPADELLATEETPADDDTPEPSSGSRTLIAAAATPPTSDASDEAMQKYEDTPLEPGEIIIALKNGNTFQGRLKKTTDEGIVLFFENGEIMLPREMLDEILPEDSEEYLPAESFPDGFVEFQHGNRMYGKILYVTSTRVVMDVAGARFVFPRSSVDVDYRHPVFVRSDLQ